MMEKNHFFESLLEVMKMESEQERKKFEENCLNFPPNAPERIHNLNRKIHFLGRFQTNQPNSIYPDVHTYAVGMCKILWIENWTSSWDTVTCKACLRYAP